VLTGAERTSLWKDIQWLADEFGLRVAPDPKPEQGYFFRSDHFPFAKAGIASFSVNQGESFVAQDVERKKRLNEYAAERYHQPGDDYAEDWDFSGMEQIARFGLRLGQMAADANHRVVWVNGTLPGQK
jgi:Zn-dependent M28 family amino/carboxypeptidase